MKRAAGWSVILISVIFILVLFLTGVQQSEQPNTAETARQATLDQEITLRLKENGTVREISMQTYLLGVLGCEMPLQFESAALAAQAVAARTFTLYQCSHSKHDDCDVCSDSTCCQAWKSETALAEQFGAQWAAARGKALSAIRQTDGTVITCGGQLIEAVYFSCSGGKTEPAAAVWGSEVSYLQAVESPGEEAAAAYTAQVSITLEQFCATIKQENSAVDCSGTPAGWFGVVSYTPGGGVATMEIGGQSFTGTQLRALFSLASTCFTVAVTPEGITFETRGKGHRVGMSQYGAQAMAKAGSSYTEILTHYYTGVEIAPYTPPHTAA